MSSDVFFEFDRVVTISEWLDFAASNDITYSPNTVGQSTFYAGATEVRLPGGQVFHVSGVSVRLDREGTVADSGSGRIDWSTARPPQTFKRLSVSVGFGSPVAALGELLGALAAWEPATIGCSPELDHFCVEIPRRVELEPGERLEIMSTDYPGGWTFAGGEYSARVQSGEAVISPGDAGRWSLSVSGVRRASFRDLDSAFAFAGRCDWDWWEGARPETPAGPVPALR